MLGGSKFVMIKNISYDIDFKQDKLYKRNFWAFMLESFLFSFSLSIFSHTTVLPMYVSNLTDNQFYIGLISLIFFSFSNISSIFSSVIASNSKNAKMVTVFICFLQRIGLALIYSSVFWVSSSKNVALIVFFTSYSFYSVTAGMSSPVFFNLVSRVITRDLSSFFGSYIWAGAVSGFLGSFAVNKLLKMYSFPDNYNYLFLMAVITALLATLAMYFGVKDLGEQNVENKMTFKMLPVKFQDIIKTNKSYRNFIVLKLLFSAAEVAIPFYIIRLTYLDNVSDSISGMMNAIFLLTNLCTAHYLGKLGNKHGSVYLFKISAVFGIIATVFAIILPNIYFGGVIFVCMGIFINAVAIATNVSNIEYAPQNEVPVYSSLTGIIVAPVYALFSMVGGVLVSKTSINAIFILALIIYVGAFIAIRRSYKNG